MYINSLVFSLKSSLFSIIILKCSLRIDLLVISFRFFSSTECFDFGFSIEAIGQVLHHNTSRGTKVPQCNL